MLLVINLVELFDSLNCAKVQLQFKKKSKTNRCDKMYLIHKKLLLIRMYTILQADSRQIPKLKNDLVFHKSC